MRLVSPADLERSPNPDEIDLAARLLCDDGGVVMRPEVTLPAGAEASVRYRLNLPQWKRAVYYAPFQRHSINPALDLWPDGLNQCQPLPITDLATVKRGGLFLPLELANGYYLALLPLTGWKAMAWLAGGEGDLWLYVSHFGSEPMTADLPLLSHARGADVYATCRQAWVRATAHPLMSGVTELRERKTYPEVFTYLGWCSFEEYKLDIDERRMVTAVEALSTGPVPVRWALIDDGHVDDGCHTVVNTQEGAAITADNDPSTRRLRSVGTHPKRFPRGWRPLREAVHGQLRWLGIWLNFNGYWGGIDLRANWPEDVRRALVTVGEDRALVGPGRTQTDAFWRHFTQAAKEGGVDFLKVDNQAGNLKLLAGNVPNAVATSVANKQSLEALAGVVFDRGLINCMAHNGVGAFHTPVSAVTRCSEDYKKSAVWRAKHHLHNSFGNMLWLGPSVWGDHDMFHTSDEVAGAMMARSKALSGGPVYLSDHPERLRFDLVEALCCRDGRLLRPLAPAQPLPDSIFLDPYESDQAFRVAAPLPHGGAAVGCYNLAHPNRAVRGGLFAADLAAARRMLAEDEGRETEDRVVALDVLQGRAWWLTRTISFDLAPMTDRLFVLAPIVDGAALLGSPDKYLGPDFVERFERSGDQLLLTVREPGRIWLWLERAVAKANGASVRHVNAHLCEIAFEGKSTGCELRLGGAVV